MKKIRVIIFGTRPLSVKIYNQVKKSKHFELVGIVSKKPTKNSWWKKDVYYLKKNKFIKEKSIKSTNFDLGVSVNWEKLISKEMLKKPKYGFINIHNSYQNVLRGRNIFYHCITGNKFFSKNFGSTLHIMNEKFDAGKIIMSVKIKIHDNDTSWDLYKKFNSNSLKIFKKYFSSLYYLKKKIKLKKMKSYYFKKKLNIDKNFTNLPHDKEFFNKVRALNFPGFVPPYVIIKNARRYLFTRYKKNRNLYTKIKFNRNIFKIYYSEKYK